jgi:hypothetical protein
MPLDLIEELAASQCHNSFLVALTAGGKRFFCALNDQQFLENALDTREIEKIKQFIVPTYSYGSEIAKWNDARNNKDSYILKHQSRGRSEEVYAGVLTSEARWQELMTAPAADEMVLQPFIEQKVFSGYVGDEIRNDYIAGTLLYFNDEFFGPGLYRTHVSPVTSGIGNFRKIAPLVSKCRERINGLHYL